jgi:glucose/arabinose dehydrogenase
MAALCAVALSADIRLKDFTELLVATGLNDATAMAFAPDGRLFVCEKEGALRLIRNGSLLPAPILTLSVDQIGERGLIGIAVDPGFPQRPYLYLQYSVPSFPAHNRVSRFTLSENLVRPESELVLLDLTPLGSAVGHNGGALHFGADGKLYIAVGDNETPANSQSLTSHQGKLLRINPDGSIPADNPFASQLTGSLQAIWAIGLRNPYTFAVQPGTGRIFINDVGNHDAEEIDEGIPGANYGWPDTEGYTTDPRFKSPFFAYPHIGSGLRGAAIVGGTFYNPVQPQYPSEFQGTYFFADYVSGWITQLDLSSRAVTPFADSLAAPVDLQVGPDGNLYYLSRGSDQIVTDSNGLSYFVATAQSSVFKFVYAPNQIPVFTQQPANVTVAAGQSASFRAAGYGSTPLSYEWQRNGIVISGANSSVFTLNPATLADDGAQFRCVLRNALGSAPSAAAVLHVTGGTPPAGTILSPNPSLLYRAGDTIAFSGQAADAEDGALPPGAFEWQVVFHHDTHTHPFLNSIAGVTQGSFTIPITGETSANVWYRVYLTVKDSSGLTQTSFVDIHPQTVTLRLETVPYGLGVSLEDQPRASAWSVDGVVGLQRTLGAISPQSLDGFDYRFVSWSDGNAQVHNILTPAVSTTYRAWFQSPQGNARVPVSDSFRSATLNTGLWTFVNPLGDATASVSASGAALTLPAGSAHDAWIYGNTTPRLLQPVPNADQSAEAKFDSAVTSAYQDQGILVEQDNANFLRLHVYHDGTQVQASLIGVFNGTAVTLFQQAVPNARPPYVLRFRRVADTWHVNWFINGAGSDLTADVPLPMTVNRVGVYSGNNGTVPGNAPGFTALIDYFVNTFHPL